MPKYIVRILKVVQVLEKVEERVIEVMSEDAAKREAAFILAESYPDKTDIVVETEQSPDSIRPPERKKKDPYAPF